MYTQIVFTDVVGYSQRPSWAQRDIVIHFGGIVNQCLSSLGLLTDFAPILLPTGDGMVIVLTGELNVGSHLNLALALLERLESQQRHLLDKDSVKYSIRVGIAEGNDLTYLDINGRENIAGNTINEAQRVCSQAQASQLTVSEGSFTALSESGSPHAANIAFRHEVIIKNKSFKIYQYVKTDLVYLNSAPLEAVKLETRPRIPNFSSETFDRIIKAKAHSAKKRTPQQIGNQVQLKDSLSDKYITTLGSRHADYNKFEWWSPSGDHFGANSTDIVNTNPAIGIFLTSDFNSHGGIYSAGPVIIIGSGSHPWVHEVYANPWIVELAPARIERLFSNSVNESI
ncbi:hypothetical protein KQY10_06950 [Leptospira interrogans]|uniref:Guanylate cyclase domain-containing protein n=3 Tax=Leptospira interrogans TaxID=173 RepID=A0AAV9FTN5_LEPIR|nr:hypothetical protein [Leptospira interrogans]EMM96987.1 adenylate/guanylate cyclase catalytic domain protein [Leptospira interrogans serovar Zanoni str. LT2156]ALE40604.1 hypothetical protein G436_3453 [Leptospira interrogans serovar Hardjo str. Norma]EJP04165.1 adenylate/guanylate cyclase catalytic domain protein [Leptospira interrogans serovar Bulgarica str. Mallika]EKO96459.1 adenylate/guanylate cyclase catalytic domain protein [Leptospira interrogans str. Brem 329]EKR25087.1 adenylate/g